jgi:hydroxyacylglutathione hydrolase
MVKSRAEHTGKQVGNTMPLEIVTVPCLKDNYAFLAHDAATGATAVIDVPEAAPILNALAERQWRASHILITHHHSDHIDGVEALAAATGARVIGAAADAHRLPPLDDQVRPGDAIRIGLANAEVIDVSGHTVGHVAFHFPDSRVVFTADSLMAAGCGRLFEGTPAQMWDSLSRLAALPADTLVCSGHEYTTSNLRFGLTIEPGNADLVARAEATNAARAKGMATVPSLLSLELATNPFLRARLPGVKAAIGMPAATDAEAFTEIRARKDRF